MSLKDKLRENIIIYKLNKIGTYIEANEGKGCRITKKDYNKLRKNGTTLDLPDFSNSKDKILYFFENIDFLDEITIKVSEKSKIAFKDCSFSKTINITANEIELKENSYYPADEGTMLINLKGQHIYFFFELINSQNIKLSISGYNNDKQNGTLKIDNSYINIDDININNSNKNNNFYQSRIANSKIKGKNIKLHNIDNFSLVDTKISASNNIIISNQSTSTENKLQIIDSLLNAKNIKIKNKNFDAINSSLNTKNIEITSDEKLNLKNSDIMSESITISSPIIEVKNDNDNSIFAKNNIEIQDNQVSYLKEKDIYSKTIIYNGNKIKDNTENNTNTELIKSRNNLIQVLKEIKAKAINQYNNQKINNKNIKVKKKI